MGDAIRPQLLLFPLVYFILYKRIRLASQRITGTEKSQEIPKYSKRTSKNLKRNTSQQQCLKKQFDFLEMNWVRVQTVLKTCVMRLSS